MKPDWNELEACRESLREHMQMLKQHQAALDDILDLIDQWQRDGRNGHCRPVIIYGKQLEALEELADERRRDNCKQCDGTGASNDGLDTHCQNCKPLAGT